MGSWSKISVQTSDQLKICLKWGRGETDSPPDQRVLKVSKPSWNLNKASADAPFIVGCLPAARDPFPLMAF